MDKLFNPRSIAMIGASAAMGKWGSIILFNLLNGGYSGKVYPVNPNQKSILGFDCYPNVGAIPDDVDVAMITTPSHTVLPLIDECGDKNIPFIILVTSNFSETGEEGAELERQVVAKARCRGVRIVGPNTMGIFSAGSSLHALMPPNMPLTGTVSMFSQSGNLGTQMLAWGETDEVGFQKFVSSGNEGDLTCLDYLAYFGRDEATKVIMAYIEGVEPDSDLVGMARDISRKKPIVILKGGRTEVGGKAAASHSGAMAGSTRIYEAAFRQSGMIEVRTSQGLMDCAKVFSSLPVPKGNRVAILTRGGGWGVITADACEEHGLQVPPLPEKMKTEIDTFLPKYWSRSNPIDMVAVIGAEPFNRCLELLSEWDGIDAIIAAGGTGTMTMKIPEKSRLPEQIKQGASQFMPQPDTGGKNTEDCIGEVIEKSGKPIINISLGDRGLRDGAYTGYRPVTFPTPERAVQSLTAMVQYRRFLNSGE